MRKRKQRRPRREVEVFRAPRSAEAESADQPELRFRWLHLTLAGIGVAAIVGGARFANVAWIDRYAAEVATQAFGMLVTLLVVQRLFERQERARRLRGSVGALRRGSRALSSIAWTWADVVSGSLRRLPSTTPVALEDLFAPHFTEDLAHWDPHAERAEDIDNDGERAEPGEPAGRWAVHLFTAAREALNEIIVTYSGSLDPAYIEAIDELVDDPFLRIIQDLMTDPAIDLRERRVRLNAARAHREAHFHRLLATISIHNALAAEAGRLRSRQLAPRTGSVGLRLALDHDLKVNLAIEPRWWLARTLPNAAPRAPATS